MPGYENVHGQRVEVPSRNVFFTLAALIIFIVGIVLLVGSCSSLERTESGEYGVVRNGGPFDDRGVRQVMGPNSGLTWTGLFSDTHTYPANQRFYTISSGKGSDGGASSTNTPSSDGVDVGIEGTLYFNLSGDRNLLEEFDDRFGTRQFGGLYPYEDEEGWRSFLNAVIRPVIDNNLRKQIGSVRCAELISSCALVQNSGSAPRRVQDENNNENIARIEASINEGLRRDIQNTLAGAFLDNLRFNVVKVDLPPQVDRAVKESQASFAEVTKAEARVEQAKAEGRANRERQRGYERCPACARIDQLKAIPPSITTYAPGGDYAVTR